MNEGLRRYQFWKWNIPKPDGSLDQIELILGIGGRETITLNGSEVSTRHSYRFKSSYPISLADGRIATLVIQANWRKFGIPECTVTVDGELIKNVEGGDIIDEKVPSEAIPLLTPPRKLWTVIREIYEIGIASLFIAFFVWVHRHANERMKGMLIFWCMFAVLGLTLRLLSLMKASAEARQRNVPLVAVLFERAVIFRQRSIQFMRPEREILNPSARKRSAWTLPATLALLPLILVALLVLIALLQHNVRLALIFFSAWTPFLAGAIFFVVRARAEAVRENITISEALYLARLRRNKNRVERFKRGTLANQQRHFILFCVAGRRGFADSSSSTPALS